MWDQKMELSSSTPISPVLPRQRTSLPLPLLPPLPPSGAGVVGVGVGVLVVLIIMERKWCWRRDGRKTACSSGWRGRRKDFWKLVTWWFASAGRQSLPFSILLPLPSNHYYDGALGGAWWGEQKRKGSKEEEKRKPKKRKKRKEYTTKKRWRRGRSEIVCCILAVVIYPFFVFNLHAF